MRWLTNLYDFRFKGTATAEIGIRPIKAWLLQLANFKNTIWHFRRTICNKNSILNLEKMPQKCMECFRLLSEHLAWIEHQFQSGIRDSRQPGSLWGMIERGGRSKEDNTLELIGQRVMVRVTMLSFKEFRNRFQGKRPALLKSALAFPPGQYTSPQLHTCHWLFDQDGHQDSSSPSL